MVDLDELKNKYIENAGTNAGNLTSDEVFELIDRLQAAESELAELENQEPILWTWLHLSGLTTNIFLSKKEAEDFNDGFNNGEAIPLYAKPIPAKQSNEEIEKLKSDLHELRMQYVSDFGQEQENNPIYQYCGAPGFWVDCDLKLYNLMEGKHRRIVYLQPAQSNSEIPKTYHAAAVRVCPDRDIEIRSGYPAPSLKDINIPEMKEFIHRFKNSMIGDQDAN